MQDFVWTRWVLGAGLLASVAVLWALFVPNAFPWMGLAGVSLVFSAALLLRMSLPRPMALVMDAIEDEPLPLAPARVPVAKTLSNAGLARSGRPVGRP